MPKRPWTPYAVLCSTELCFRRLCNFDLPNKQRFSLQRHKSTRIRLVPNSGTVCRIFYGGILYWLLEKQGKLYFLQSSQTKGRGVLLRLETPVLSAALCKSSSPVQKLKNSAKQNSWTVRRFSLWNVFSFMEPAVWGFGLGLLGGQGFIGAKAPLDPLCRALWHRASFWQPLQPWFVKETAFFFAKAQNSGIRLVPDSGTGCRFYAQSFVLAAFATLVCQRNCVFLCKGTKLQNSAKPNSWIVMPVFCGTELKN